MTPAGPAPLGAALCLTFGLAACGTAGDLRPVAAPGLALMPASAGLDVAGSGGREIGFGRARDGAVASAARVAGVAPRPVACPEAGRDAIALGDLVMVFERDNFVGWRQGDASAGVGCGASA